jgi:hypothetical protein
MTIPSKPSSARTVNIKPGANGESLTSQVANAGEKPEDIQMPTLNPKDTLVRRMLTGNRSTSHELNGPQ